MSENSQTPGADQNNTAPASGAEQTPPAPSAPAQEPENKGAPQPGAEPKAGDQPEGKEGEEKKEPAGPPEAYDLKAPDGLDLDTQMVEAFTPVAKSLNLTNEQAQMLTDFYSKNVVLANVQEWEKTLGEWKKDIESDKNIGGANLDANLAVAKKALESFGSPELLADLDRWGFGNNPHLIRFAFKVGQALSADKLVTGDPGEDRGGPKMLSFKMN